MVSIVKKKAIKTASKRVIQKTAETNGHLTGNKIADKITSVSNKSSQNAKKELYPKTDEIEMKILKERYVSPEKRQQLIGKLRLL